MAVGVWCEKTPALVTGAVFQLMVLCQIGPAISTAPISVAMQAFWTWTFTLMNVAIAFYLVRLLAAPNVSKGPS